jgi:hypothetical protein
VSDDILDRYTRGNQSAPVAAGSFTPSDIFSKYDRDNDAPAKTPDTASWKDHEALENLAAQGIKPPSEPAKPGRGIVQALKDYPGHVLSGMVDTVAAPGNVLASPQPSTSESLIPSGLGIAGLVTGNEFPRVGGAALAEKGMTKVAPSTRAVNQLVDTVGAENVPEAVAALKNNPRLTLADVSNGIRIRTQGLMAGGTPDVQNVISSAVRDRAGSRLEATNTAFTNAMGAAPDVVQMVEGLKDRARKAGQEAIQPALENSKLVDTSPVIKAIDEKLQPGIQAMLDPKSQLPLSAEQQELARLKQQLVSGNGEQLFDAQRLHRIQSDVGDRAYQLSKSPDPKDRLLGGQLRTMNEKLIDQIDKASSGTYRPARAKFKDAKDISEAFESGFDTLKNRSGLSGALEDSPQAFRNWMKDATPEEVVARRLGTRADIDQKINSVKNGALKGETITSIPYNQEKLTALFGNKEAGRLIRVMQDSQKEAQTNAAIMAGSKTAETAKAAKDIEVRKVGGGNPLQYVAPIAAEVLGQSAGIPGAGLAASLAAKGVHMGAQKLGQMHDIAKNAAFARNALATGPAREETINRLLSHPKVVRELKKRANALTAP